MDSYITHTHTHMSNSHKFQIKITVRITYNTSSKKDRTKSYLIIMEWIISLILHLNCPCHLYGFKHYRMHNWTPFCLVKSKVVVDMGNLFLFQFCLRDLLVKIEDAPCHARPNHGKGALALGQIQLKRTFQILCVFVIRNLLRTFTILDALNHFLPLPVVYVNGSLELKLSQRESTFFVNRSCVTWRVFIFDEQITKTKLK